MSIEIGPLLLGRLVYEQSVPMLDNVRFERVEQGFAQHYEVRAETSDRFSFARGEGYLRLERLDAFGYVDGGRVERLRDGATDEVDYGGNVVMMPSRCDRLRFDLNLRVAIIFWVFALGTAWWFIGGDWLIWLILFVAAYGTTIALVRRSLLKKMDVWLARKSWN